MPLPYSQTNTQLLLVTSLDILSPLPTIFSTLLISFYSWLPLRSVFLAFLFPYLLIFACLSPFFALVTALRLGWRTYHPLDFCLVLHPVLGHL